MGTNLLGFSIDRVGFGRSEEVTEPHHSETISHENCCLQIRSTRRTLNLSGLKYFVPLKSGKYMRLQRNTSKLHRAMKISSKHYGIPGCKARRHSRESGEDPAALVKMPPTVYRCWSGAAPENDGLPLPRHGSILEYQNATTPD